MKQLFTLFPAIFLLMSSCQDQAPELIVQQEYIIGQSFNLKATNLIPGETYSIIARKIDNYDREWVADATFVSDHAGQIDISKDKPNSGSYSTSDPLGLLWSMIMPNPPGEDWEAPEPRDYAEVTFSLLNDRDTLDNKMVTQWIIPSKVKKEVLQGDMVAEVYTPKELDGQHPAILLLGGSGGGLSWASRIGALMAEQGYVTLALAYFNAGDLPQYLAQLPLEYVENAIDYLKSREDVDSLKIGMIGYSRGAELALLIASRRPDIKGVVGIAPGSAVFQGFKPPKYPVLSSWTAEGEDLAFVPNSYDKRFFETYDGMYLWYRTLAQHEKLDNASIPIENINGPILFLTGIKDQIWPTTFMAEKMVARLHIEKFPYNYEHLAFPNAGHGIAEPPGYPTTGVANRLGGTPLGNHQARAEAWRKINEFYKTLGE